MSRQRVPTPLFTPVLVLGFFACILGSGMVVAEDGGIGMSGSLYALSPIVVPQGGEVRSDSFFIVVYNHMGSEAVINLTYEAPGGVKLGFEPAENPFTLPPGGSKRIRIYIRVSEDILPGDYDVYVRAVLLNPPRRGLVSVSTSVSQHFVIRVVGESSSLHVKVIDPGGGVVSNALIRVYPVGKRISVYDSYSGVLDAILVPGRYRVVAYLSGEPVAESFVTLKSGEDISIVLNARVLYVERLIVKPVISGDSVAAARIRVVLVNLYKTLRDVTVVLSVSKDGVVIENRTLIASSTLPKGRSDYTFDYVPPGGFEPGNYTFRILVYGFGDKLVAVSKPRWMYIHPSGVPPALAAAAAPAALLPLAAVYYRRRRRGRR